MVINWFIRYASQLIARAKIGLLFRIKERILANAMLSSSLD